ncbi:DUF6356 family protein [Rhodobacteraceae bacterium D3-12]|nr:DUF6356 family protein [Rhodobacteraceae bacterium D3-12]
MADAQSNTRTPSNPPLARLFLDHPHSVNESYFGHMRFALGFAFWLGLAALAAMVHAILPFACETTASRITRRLYARIEHRGPET